MLSAAKIKLIRSLQKKKFRKANSLFVAEGHKLVLDILNSKLAVEEIFLVNDANIDLNNSCSVQHITQKEMERISGLTTPTSIFAIVRTPDYQIDTKDIASKLSIALDDIQDPGNLGTIIRIADWFGINTIICSEGTVDAFSPKVVQATMGSIARIKIYYSDISNILDNANKLDLPTYGTFLNGENIYSAKLQPKGVIVFGNEGKGISKSLEHLITHKISIPNFAEGEQKGESLNVAMATAIVCAEFRRRFS